MVNVTPSFWENKKVLVTGATGFKGAWLCQWLLNMKANVSGYALAPHTQPSLFSLLNLKDKIKLNIADIRNYNDLNKVVENFKPEIFIHMAAQALVRASYSDPLTTFSTNVMGTVNSYETLRHNDSIRVFINVTSDKCYENKEWERGYTEQDRLGGHDPYSNSKGCAEMVSSSFYNSYFSDHSKQLGIASVRAGNVIGGGDWGEDRLIPDCIKALYENKTIKIRNPYSQRPWQHVLEPLSGYLVMAEKLWRQPKEFSGAWNFGPLKDTAQNVEQVANKLVTVWGDKAKWSDVSTEPKEQLHEAHFLKLDCTKAIEKLNWSAKLNFDQTLTWVVDWYKTWSQDENVEEITNKQINNYIKMEHNNV